MTVIPTLLVLIFLVLLNATVIKDTLAMDMMSVSKLALKNAFMVNVAKDQIINVFVIWDTLGLIVIQIVDVMGTPFVIIWDQVVVMTANIILKENSATCVPKAVLATLLPLKDVNLVFAMAMPIYLLVYVIKPLANAIVKITQRA